MLGEYSCCSLKNVAVLGWALIILDMHFIVSIDQIRFLLILAEIPLLSIPDLMTERYVFSP